MHKKQIKKQRLILIPSLEIVKLYLNKKEVDNLCLYSGYDHYITMISNQNVLKVFYFGCIFTLEKAAYLVVVSFVPFFILRRNTITWDCVNPFEQNERVVSLIVL